MFLSPNQSVLCTFVPVTGTAEQLDVLGIARPAVCDCDDVVQFKFLGFLQAASTFAFLFLEKCSDVVSRASATIRHLTCATVDFGCTSDRHRSLGVFLLPVGHVHRPLVTICCGPMFAKLARFLGVCFSEVLAILAVLPRVFVSPRLGGAVDQWPIGRFPLGSARISFRFLDGVRNKTLVGCGRALNAFSSRCVSIGLMAVLAYLVSAVEFLTGSFRGQTLGNGLHAGSLAYDIGV